MIVRRSATLLIAAFACLWMHSCSGNEPYRKPTTKVTGKITIDGSAPNPPAQVECVADSGMDANHPTLSRCDTKEDGSFEIATYQQGDGVPAGDYALIFTWKPFNVMSRDYGPDKFKGKYAKKEDPAHKFTIKEGDPPMDLGTFALSSKN
jgi:hypothetical protein